MRAPKTVVVVAAAASFLVASASARAQVAASLEGADGVVARCADAGESCRLALARGAEPGWYRLRATGPGAAIDSLLALRGIEDAVDVATTNEGELVVDRIYPFPATLTLTLLRAPEPASDAPWFLLYDAMSASVSPHGIPRGVFLGQLSVDPGGAGVFRPVPMAMRCGTWLFQPPSVIAPGQGVLALGTPPTGAHAPFDPGARYRFDLCVDVETDVWWEDTVDPLALLPSASGVVANDVLCARHEWSGAELRDATTGPLLPSPARWRRP